MRQDFAAFLNGFTEPHEGRVIEHDPNDPGGTTVWGVDDPDWRTYCHAKGRDYVPLDQLFRSLPADQGAALIADVYLTNHWLPLHCDALPWPVDVVLFDMGVNQGNGRAVEALQGVVGVTQDGAFGPNTMAAVMGPEGYVAKHGAQQLANLIDVRRLAGYNALYAARPAWAGEYINGWRGRVNDLSVWIKKPAPKS